MKAEEFEKKVLERDLIPIEVVTNRQGEVRWFAAKAKEQIVLFDAEGYAYTAPAMPNAEDFVFSGEVPKYHGHTMDFDPHQNLIF